MSRDAVEVGWEPADVPAGTHTVPVRIYRPGPDRRGWLVWAPGGSWQAGSVESWHETGAALARYSECTVVTVGYRLAPRHRHPAQLEDVLTVLDWAQGQDGDATAVGGDSAGGTLAAAAALVRRDRGEHLAAQVLAYPPLDPSCAAPSYTRLPGAFPSAPHLRAAWRLYRGDPRSDRSDGERLYSTPLEADRFDRLAPAVLAVGELDPVIDDVTAYARRLRAAGGEVTLRTFPGTPHAAVLGDSAPAGGGPSLRQWLGVALRARMVRHASGPPGGPPPAKGRE
ncbi:alpha/beta hydrolase fold domain-containing protein [Actinomadura rubrisoli]|uniref:Alpha/beta hydrolase n=1 Tax=Actinomadura rubrisoli TaxID=2530368 RepID=A0A4R5BD62_9ACTN|nr:alpha/beta hydrolase fold domain-containing protein [Actinomadura rubrisoli]TDD83189.1 alpha/beta hydrolase [Actinomadura rubrisoli]